MKNAKTLPKMLPGTVQPRFVRCYRPGCRCADGPYRHGPYFVRIWREGGRVRKRYIPLSKVDDVRARCEERRAFMRELRAGREAAQTLIATFRTGATQ
jgi:hypothetical protein